MAEALMPETRRALESVRDRTATRLSDAKLEALATQGLIYVVRHEGRKFAHLKAAGREALDLELGLAR